MTFDISNRGLTSLKDVEFPAGVTELDCSWNQLTSLDGCPEGVTTIDCGENQLTKSVIDEFRESHQNCRVFR